MSYLGSYLGGGGSIGPAPTPTPPTPVPIPVPLPIQANALQFLDHSARALSRIPEQFKAKNT